MVRPTKADATKIKELRGRIVPDSSRKRKRTPEFDPHNISGHLCTFEGCSSPKEGESQGCSFLLEGEREGQARVVAAALPTPQSKKPTVVVPPSKPSSKALISTSSDPLPLHDDGKFIILEGSWVVAKMLSLSQGKQIRRFWSMLTAKP